MLVLNHSAQRAAKGLFSHHVKMDFFSELYTSDQNWLTLLLKIELYFGTKSCNGHHGQKANFLQFLSIGANTSRYQKKNDYKIAKPVVTLICFEMWAIFTHIWFSTGPVLKALLILSSNFPIRCQLPFLRASGRPFTKYVVIRAIFFIKACNSEEIVILIEHHSIVCQNTLDGRIQGLEITIDPAWIFPKKLNSSTTRSQSRKVD